MLKYSKELNEKYGLTLVSEKDKNAPIISWSSLNKNNCMEHIKDDLNLAVICGSVSNLVCIDIDNKDNNINNWFKILDDMKKDGIENSLDTAWEKTPNGGLHYFFLYDEKFNDITSKEYKITWVNSCLIEVKSNKSKTTIAPSINPANKNKYETIKDFSHIKPFPWWLYELIISNIEFEKNDISHNNKITSDDIDKFKQSKYYNDLMKFDNIDNENRLPVRMPLNYSFDCLLCNKKHIRNSNRSFLWKNKNNDLYFTCRVRHSILIYKEIIMYDDLKKTFEETNFKVLNPFSYCSLINGDLRRRTRKELYDVYENLYYDELNDKIKYVKSNFIKTWTKDEKIRTYEKIDFLPYPLDCPKEIYNIFNGLEVEKINEEPEKDLTIVLNHIKILCGNDDKTYNYFIKWLSHLVQYPGHKIRVAPIFQSSQGVGKNMFFDWFGNKLLGENYYFSTSRADDLFGRFAVGLKNKILINLNETNLSDTSKHTEKIKSYITDGKISIEQKGVDTCQINDCSSWIFTTNNNIPLVIEKDDRRFFVIECCNEKKNDKLYFETLNDFLNKKSTIKGFYNFLMEQENIKTFDFINNRPTSKMYDEIKNLSLPPVVQFLNNYLFKINENNNVLASELYEIFNEWKNENGFKYEISSTRFGIDAIKYGGLEKKRSGKGFIYSINKSILEETLLKNNCLITFENIELSMNTEIKEQYI